MRYDSGMRFTSKGGRLESMTTAKKSGSKKDGKSGGGKKSPPTRAASERKRKSRARDGDASSDSGMPKVSKTEAGGGRCGGGLH
jgi:hypothetical protein